MSLANCPQCGRLFNKMFRDICPACVKEEEAQFFKVREYLKQHRNAKPYEVSEATEVAVQTIYKFVREGRLQAAYYDGLHYECEKCGKPITSGKVCRDCMEELSRKVKLLQEKVVTEKEERKTGYHHDFREK